MEKRLAYFEMSIELLEEALKIALGMPENVHIQAVTMEHDFMYSPPKSTMRIVIENPEFAPLAEGQMIPRKEVQVKSERWEFR